MKGIGIITVAVLCFLTVGTTHGQSCTSDSECTSTTAPRCIPASEASDAAKSCAATSAQGGFCDSNLDCTDSGAYTVRCVKSGSASNGVCGLKLTSAGETCNYEHENSLEDFASQYSLECTSTTLYCASTGACASSVANGGACTVSRECGTGWCSSNVCASYTATGSACTTSDQCGGDNAPYTASYYVCTNSVCAHIVAALVEAGLGILLYVIIAAVAAIVIPIIICIICCCCCAAGAGAAAAKSTQRY